MLKENARRKSIPSGIAAIVAIVVMNINLFQDIAFYNSYGVSVDFSDMLPPIIWMISMLMFAVYAFVFYGRKKPVVLGLSAAIMAGLCIRSSIGYVSRIRLLNDMDFMVDYIRLTSIRLIVNILYAIIFIILAVKYLFNISRMNIRVFPVIAVVLGIINIFLGGSPSFLTIILGIPYRAIPFLLFAFLCPTDEKKSVATSHDSYYHGQEFGDVELHLRYLNDEYYGGRMSLQEYDARRKSLLERL